MFGLFFLFLLWGGGGGGGGGGAQGHKEWGGWFGGAVLSKQCTKCQQQSSSVYLLPMNRLLPRSRSATDTAYMHAVKEQERGKTMDVGYNWGGIVEAKWSK